MATEQRNIYEFNRDWAFLSNAYPCRITSEKRKFTSVEAAFQAACAADPEDKDKFASRGMWSDPARAASAGRRVEHIPNREDKQDGIMLDLLRLKFRDPILAGLLLSTGTGKLINGEPDADPYWGDPGGNGTGKNRLGALLTQVRKELE